MRMDQSLDVAGRQVREGTIALSDQAYKVATSKMGADVICTGLRALEGRSSGLLPLPTRAGSVNATVPFSLFLNPMEARSVKPSLSHPAVFVVGPVVSAAACVGLLVASSSVLPMWMVRSGRTPSRWQVAGGWPVPVVAGWDGLVAGSGAGRAFPVAGDVCLHVEEVDDLLFAVQVELVDAGAGLVQCLAVGDGGVRYLGERFLDALQAGQGLLSGGQFGLSGSDHEPGGGGSNPAARAAWYSVAMVCCSRETSLDGVGDAGYEGVGADVQSRAAAPCRRCRGCRGCR